MSNSHGSYGYVDHSSTEWCHDRIPVISAIPGPRGAAGGAGSPGGAGASGRSAYTNTTASFTMPAALGSVTVAVADTAWVGVGQPLFVETAGQFTVAAVLSPTSLSLTAQAVPTNAAALTVIASGKRVSPAGISTLNDYESRIYALESGPNGNVTFYGSSAPGGTKQVGDLWFQIDGGGNVTGQFRWDGSAWVNAFRKLALADFGTGIRPILTVTSLPVSGSVGEFVSLTTDAGRLYRWTGSAWSKAVATGDLVGQVDGSTFIVDGTIVAAKLGAGSVTADSVGANQIIAHSACIASGVIQDAHISTLAAGKITAGDLQSVNLGYAGRLFHTTYPSRKFRSVEFGTAFESSKSFGSGSAYGFSHGTPVIAYAPGHASWGLSGAPTACPDVDGRVRVQLQGRLIGYTGNILLYGQINNGAYFPLAARNSADGGDAIIDASRVITIAPTDQLKFFVAPANGNGDATPGITCRYELDALIFNF